MHLLHFHICFEHNIDMIFLKAQYFNLNRILLQSTALWPFQQSKFAQLQFIINSFIDHSHSCCYLSGKKLLCII